MSRAAVETSVVQAASIPSRQPCSQHGLLIGQLLVQAANYLDLQQQFYAFIIPFIAFFFSFAFIIYPNASALHPTRAALHLSFKWVCT